MVELFHKEDSHFLVFFDADKTVQLLPKQKINFLDHDNVTVLFPTSNLLEDGTEEIQDIPYTGRVFFSGSASKCRGIKTKINEGDGHGKDTDFFTSLQNLAKEIKSCGKRGASIKLKKALEEETREIAAKGGKKQKSKSDTVTTSSAGDKKTKRKTKHEAPCSEPAAKKSKSQTAKDLKLKEMMAFAGISLANDLQTTDSNMDSESSDAETSSKANDQATSEIQIRSSPKKTPTKSSGASSKTIVQATSKAQTRNTPKKPSTKSLETSSKTTDKATSEIQTRSSPQKTPTKSSGASSKTIVQATSKAQTRNTPKKPSTKSLETSSKTTDKATSEIQTRSSPQKTPTKSSGASSKTIVQATSKAQTRNTPKKPSTKSLETSSKTTDKATSEIQTRSSPQKTPTKSSGASSKTNVQATSKAQTRSTPKKPSTKSLETSSKTTDKATSEVKTRSSPRKKKASSETTSNLNVTSKATNELQTRSSPRKTTSTETSAKNASALFDFATSSATSSLVSSSLNLLNAEIDDDLESTNVAYNNTEEFGHFSHSYYEPEYGYNSDLVQSETSGQPYPIQNITGYYQRLDSTQQGTILGFLNMLSDELHKITYGQPPSSTNDPCSSNTTTLSAAPILSGASSTDENERKVPLIMDAESLFKDILVNPSKLRNAESAALMAKNPPAFLLNKILDLVFHPDELKFSKGVKGLNTHKMEAINEYLFAWCLKMNMENVTAKMTTTIIQNKIGNLRFKGQKKTKLVTSK